ncbi:MAG: hypothetical protein IKA87_10185 [Lentisphaeria bacterium]|nr:hypothetical protein [Lentisphaeria bacterium]
MAKGQTEIMNCPPEFSAGEYGGKISLKQEIFFWLTAVLFLFIFLGSAPLGHTESTWAEISREMLMTGNFWHTAINWQLCGDKNLMNC